MERSNPLIGYLCDSEKVVGVGLGVCVDVGVCGWVGGG